MAAAVGKSYIITLRVPRVGQKVIRLTTGLHIAQASNEFVGGERCVSADQSAPSATDPQVQSNSVQLFTKAVQIREGQIITTLVIIGRISWMIGGVGGGDSCGSGNASGEECDVSVSSVKATVCSMHPRGGTCGWSTSPRVCVRLQKTREGRLESLIHAHHMHG